CSIFIYNEPPATEFYPLSLHDALPILNEGKYPAILLYSEIFQQTGPIRRSAQIMAGHGFIVLVPEVFHELNPIGTVLGYDDAGRSEEHTSELQSRENLVCRLLLEKKK